MKKLSNKKIYIPLFLLFFSFSCFLCTFLVKESDYFWHITAGKYMFLNGPLKEDVFSWVLNGTYWMSHEWLFELFIYFLKVIFGNFSMLIYIFSSLFMFYIIIYLYNKEKINKNLFFTTCWIACSLIFILVMQARPHFISYLFLSLTLYFILDLVRNEDSKKIYFLPLLTILWANFHGGSSNLGYLFCFFTFFIGLFQFKFEKIEAKRLSKSQLKKLFIIGFISIICTMINIHGIKMTFYPYLNMLDKTMLENITEWSPTDINNLTHLPFYVLSLIILGILLFSKKKIQLLDITFIGLGIYLGLKSLRFWPYLYIISSFFVFNYISKFKFDNMKFIMIFLSSFLLISSVFNFDKVYSEINKENLHVDKKIIDTIKEVKPKRLFNYYGYGGELIYHNILVFIDGRADLYSENGVFTDYLHIKNMQYDYKELMNKYDFDYFLVTKGSTLEKYLRTLKYQKIIESNGILLYKKV